MNILLIRPPRTEKSITLGEFMYCEPLGLEIVYTLIKDMGRITLFDMMADKRPLKEMLIKEKPDFVGFTTLCIDVAITLRLCREVKQFDPSTTTAVGGTQAYFIPEAFHSVHVDHIFTYTDKTNIRELISRIKISRTKRSANGLPPSGETCRPEQQDKKIPLINGIQSRERDYEESGVHGRNVYLHPDISCTKKYRKHYSYLGYRPCAIMQTSAGCSSKCLFCMRWRLEGGTENDYRLESVIRHMGALPEKHVMLIDNDFLNNKDRIAQFCTLLEQKRIKKNLICYASVRSILENEDQMGRLASNGLKTMLVGYETFSEKEMAFYKKGTLPESSLKAAAILKKHGIDCWASFILHPDWTKADFRSFRRHIKQLKPEISTFSPLTPFPGLPLFSIYKDRLLVSEKVHERWSFGEVTIRPLHMSLRQYYLEVLRTVLYINLVLNNSSYMVNRFGTKTLLRISRGSIKVFFKYVRLMLSA